MHLTIKNIPILLDCVEILKKKGSRYVYFFWFKISAPTSFGIEKPT